MSENVRHADETPPSADRFARLLRRIKDHRIAQWGLGYVAVAYAIQHGVTLTSDAFDWPHVVVRVSMLLLALGLPLAVTLAWYHGARASRRISGPELTIMSMLLVIGSFLFFAFVRPSAELAAPAAQQAGVTAARSAAASPKGAISVAVLPFVNLSSDKEQEFFSDGMTEEITAALAKVPDLRVVARTSAFEFKGKNIDIENIGLQLHATHLIEGSVRKAGNRVRITVQLIKTEDGTHLWSENYDRQLTDIFAIQEEIAQAIAVSLRVPLGLKQGESLIPSRTANIESYQDYLRAKARVRARGAREPGGPLTEATKLLEQVVARDPDYAPAWALLGQAHALLPTFTSTNSGGGSVEELRGIVEDSLPNAETAAQRAIRLDPNNTDGYAALALVQELRGKFTLAEDLFKQALSLDPGNTDALQIYSVQLAVTGRLKASLSLRHRLQTLEPFVPIFNFFTAQILWLNAQNDDAITMLKTLPAGNGRAVAAAIYAAEGRYQEAADALQAASGSNAETAARLLRTAPAPAAAPQSLPPLGALSFVYLYVGAPSRALEFVEDSLAAGLVTPAGMIYLWHSSAAPVRKTERFKTFVRKAGFVEYWRAKGWPDLCHPTTGDDFECG